MYYLATILLFLNVGVAERAITGPFSTLNKCIEYKQEVIEVGNNKASVTVYLADCFRKKEEHING